MEFSIEKNGYNKNEVDAYISKLTAELMQWKDRCLKAEEDYIELRRQESEIKKKGESIALALTAAIEKAKQIEASSKNVYKLKIQQITLLYNRWEMLLNEMINKYPKLEDSHNIGKMLEDFKKAIENVISKNVEPAVLNTGFNNNDTIRVLLSKMISYSKNSGDDQMPRKVKKIERNHPTFDLKGQTELQKIEEKAELIKPITNLKLYENDNYETLADKYLTEGEDEDSAYANFITKKNLGYPTPNESGFDLKEAVNPKQDLDEIMKAFDFFNADAEEA